MIGDNSGWITEHGVIEWTNHTGVEETEIHHVDLSLMAFGDEVGYPGREASHYDDGETDFWGKYGMPANEIALGQGWIQWGTILIWNRHYSSLVMLFSHRTLRSRR